VLTYAWKELSDQRIMPHGIQFIITSTV